MQNDELRHSSFTIHYLFLTVAWAALASHQTSLASPVNYDLPRNTRKSRKNIFVYFVYFVGDLLKNARHPNIPTRRILIQQDFDTETLFHIFGGQNFGGRALRGNSSIL